MDLSYENALLKEVIRIGKQGEKLYAHTYDAYDLSGNVTRSTLIGKAGKMDYTVDLRGRMTGISSEAWSGSILNYDAVGNITNKSAKDGLGNYSSKFAYDELNQLTDESGSLSEAYSCDSLYNRIRKGNADYTVNHLNQITNDGNTDYQYDLNGNLIKISNGSGEIGLSYDALNRLIRVKKEGLQVAYAYDERNRRLSKTVSSPSETTDKTFKYFYQDLNEVGCYENDKLIELRVLGIGKGAEIGAAVAMEFNDTVYAPIHDLHGNVISLVEAERGREKIRMRAILSRFFRRFQISSPSITFTFRCGRGGNLKGAKKLDKSALHLYFFSASDWQNERILSLQCIWRGIDLCHSEGAINTRNALMCYNPELRKMIDVVAIAPGGYVDRYLCRDIHHYISVRDFVPLLDISGMVRNWDTIHILKPEKEANLWDHDFKSPTYSKVIIKHIKDHIKENGY